MMLRLSALVIGFCATSCAIAASPVSVEIGGHVRNPGSRNLPAESRLSVAALAGAPDAQAYLLAAALLRADAIQPQTRLKAGLMFDLQVLASQTSAIDLADAARTMSSRFASLPVPGREPQLLDPRALETSRAQNRPAKSGDRLVYPARPGTITVTGAVEDACTLPHSSTRDAHDYRNSCKVMAAASRDVLYVIQPDGQIQKVGIALWNRDEPAHLAPGAVVYVPLNAAKIGALAPELNEDAARFLATQVLDAPGVSY